MDRQTVEVSDRTDGGAREEGGRDTLGWHSGRSGGRTGSAGGAGKGWRAIHAHDPDDRTATRQQQNIQQKESRRRPNAHAARVARDHSNQAPSPRRWVLRPG